ncbi:hypothetical protein ACYOEI_22590, partial [Singulisphaera rosea]
MQLVVELIICVLMAGMAWALASEGLWGAMLMFFNIFFAGIVAFNFYEPLAALLDGTGIGWGMSDVLCLLALFTLTIVILRLITETLAPVMIRFPSPIFHLGRAVFALLGSSVAMAILLLGFECAPVNKKMFGVIDYKAKVPFGLGLERRWLGFFQHSTGLIFVTHQQGQRDPFREFTDATAFDPKGEWLLMHQQARPYGDESILEAEGGAAGAPAASDAQGAQGG